MTSEVVVRCSRYSNDVGWVKYPLLVLLLAAGAMALWLIYTLIKEEL